MRTSSKLRSSPYFGKMCFVKFWPFLEGADQGLVKGEKLYCRNPYFYFWHGESTSTASQPKKQGFKQGLAPFTRP